MQQIERWLLAVSLALLATGFVLGALAVHLSRCP